MPTLAELKKTASRLKIKGRSKMKKAELERAIANHNLLLRSRSHKPRPKKSRKPRPKKSRKPRPKKSRKPRPKKSRKTVRKKSRKPRVKKSVKKAGDVNVSSCDNYENTEPLSWESLVEDVPKFRSTLTSVVIKLQCVIILRIYVII